MNIAIYCGSSLGDHENFSNATKQLANEIAQRSMSIVYGGSSQGLMGIISNEALRLGVSVTGVIPYSLIEKEIENRAITHTHRVQSMSERKNKMEELADAFIALPGGYGTFDEIFEVLSELQLGKHNKPCAFYNINGYYDKLMEFLYACVDNGFMKKRFVDMIIVSDDPKILIDGLQAFQPIKSKWE